MDKVKLTNKRIKEFLESAKDGQRLYDSDVPQLYVRKRKTGGFFQFTYNSPDTGKRKAYPIGKFTDNTITQARKKAQEFAGRVISGEDIQETRKETKQLKAKTGRDYLEFAYKTVQARKKGGKATITAIESFFSDWLDKPMLELNDTDVIRWQAQQEKSNLKYETLKRRYNGFRTMLNHAVTKNHISHNPLKNIKLEKFHETEVQVDKRKSRRTYLTRSQIESFFYALDRYQEEKREQRRNSRAHGKPELIDLDKVEYVDHVKPVMLLLFYTGFRQGDALGLKWEEVNLNFSTITKVIEKTAHKVPRAKQFPISQPLLDALKKWHIQTGHRTKGFVFPSNRTGIRLCGSSLLKPWKKIRKLAGFPEELQLYSLRHNFASHLVMKGCDLMSVAALLGHSDIEMIVEHYGHLQPSLLKDYSNQFADMVNSSELPQKVEMTKK